MASFSQISINCHCGKSSYYEKFFSQDPDSFREMIKKISSFQSEKSCDVRIDYTIEKFVPDPKGFYSGHFLYEESRSFTHPNLSVDKFAEGLGCFNLADTTPTAFEKVADCWRRATSQDSK